MTNPSPLSSPASSDHQQLAQLAAFVICILRSSDGSWSSTIDQCRIPLTQQCTLKLFCTKVIKMTNSSTTSVHLALLYLYQLRISVPPNHSSWTRSDTRLFTVALMLASKFLEDTTFQSKAWSEIAGIPLLELNLMEAELMAALQYKLYIPHDYFFAWVAHCQEQVDARFADDTTATRFDIKKKRRLTSNKIESIHASPISPLVSSFGSINIDDVSQNTGIKRPRRSITAEDDTQGLRPSTLQRRGLSNDTRRYTPHGSHKDDATTSTITTTVSEPSIFPTPLTTNTSTNTLLKRSACDSADGLPSSKRRAYLGGSITHSFSMLTIA